MQRQYLARISALPLNLLPLLLCPGLFLDNNFLMQCGGKQEMLLMEQPQLKGGVRKMRNSSAFEQVPELWVIYAKNFDMNAILQQTYLPQLHIR